MADQFAKNCRPEAFKKHDYGDLDFIYNGPGL